MGRVVAQATKVRSPERSRRQLSRSLFGKCLDCRSFVVLYVEDGVELRYLKKIVDLLCEVEQLQLAALVAHRSKGTHQFADTGAIDVGDIAEV